MNTDHYTHVLHIQVLALIEQFTRNDPDAFAAMTEDLRLRLLWNEDAPLSHILETALVEMLTRMAERNAQALL